MDADRWRRVADLYASAQDRPAQARPAFVRDACGGDSDLRREVESLLAHDDQPAIIDAAPAGDVIAAMAGSANTTVVSNIGPYRIVSLIGAGGMGNTPCERR
jgi:hypothetical protein